MCVCSVYMVCMLSVIGGSIVWCIWCVLHMSGGCCFAPDVMSLSQKASAHLRRCGTVFLPGSSSLRDTRFV
jgi:hypothetical protein